MAESPKVTKTSPKPKTEATKPATQTESRGSILQRLLKVQVQLKVPKDKAGPQYKYRSASDILENVKPLLEAQDLLCICSDPEPIAIGERIYLHSKAIVFDIHDKNEVIAADGWAVDDAGQARMAPGQATGAASSYARKYALQGLFALDDGEDLDSLHKYPQKASTPATKQATGGVATKSDLIAELFKEMKGKGYTKDETIKELDGLSSLHYNVQVVTDLSREQVLTLLGRVKALPKKGETK